MLSAWSFGGSMQLQLNHTYGEQKLLLDSFRYESAESERFSITRLSYLLSEFEVQDERMEWHPVPSVPLWIDVSQSRLVSDPIPLSEGSFKALRFKIGLSPDSNHSDPSQYPARHPLNPNLNRLHWTWQTGYIFLALEGHYLDSEKEKHGFLYHYANDWNLTSVTLPVELDGAANNGLGITFDLQKLLGDASGFSFQTAGRSTHSRKSDPVAEQFKANLPAAFSVSSFFSAPPQPPVSRAEPIDLPENPEGYPIQLSASFPIPEFPSDNPLITRRVELGKSLFFDPILSRTGTHNCASCHDPHYAFSDPGRQSTGVSGEFTRRHSMPLFNLAWKQSFFWDGRVESLREQVLHPIVHPDEMGSSLPELSERLAEEGRYTQRFAAAFGSGEINETTISLALEAFLLTLISDNSKFDQAMRQKVELSAAEQRGFELFMTEFDPRTDQFGADCFHCHGGPLFTDNTFHNNGLAMSSDRGLAEFTGKDSDVGKFITPSLRNVALTAPYMHDGSIETLEEVIEHYMSGIHASATLAPSIAKHPEGGLPLSDEDKAALVAFLKTLTDPEFTH